MREALVLSLSNKNLNNETNILLGGEWVLENHKIKKDKEYKIFKSKSSLKKYRRINSIDADKIYQELCVDLSKELNILHSVNLSVKSWKIIFGSWLKIFVNICYERSFLISDIINSHKISKIYGTKNENFQFYSNGTLEQRFQAADYSWNNNLFFEIINFFDFQCEKDFSIETTNNHQDFKESLFTTTSKSNEYKKKLIKIFNFLKFFRKKNDALITKTGLLFPYEKLFEILFFQFPQNYEKKTINYKIYDRSQRKKLNLPYGDEKNVRNFVRKNLVKFLPICFVENFKEIFNNCEKEFPKNPKFIMTAFSWEYDVNFKFYAAKKVNENIPYFLFQHGNTYFTDDFVFNRPEYETAKKFFSFGYCKKKFSKGFCNHLTLGKKIKSKKNGLLHLVSPFLPGRIFPYEQSIETIDSLKNIYNFEKKISNNLRKKILLRSTREFSETKRGKWYADKYFNNFEKKQIDYGFNDYTKNLRNSRINIFFYDSSGILDNFIYNIPTIGVWNNLYNHIEEEFVEKYKLLKDANIIFDSVDELIVHLNNIWEDVDEWWFSEKTQRNINLFNSNFNNKGSIISLFKLRKYVKSNIY